MSEPNYVGRTRPFRRPHGFRSDAFALAHLSPELRQAVWRVQEGRAVWDELCHSPEGKASIPPHLFGGLDRYFRYREQPGRFLRAVLENDLNGAIVRACPGTLTLASLRLMLQALFTWAPGRAWGSPEAVRSWTEPAEQWAEACRVADAEQARWEAEEVLEVLSELAEAGRAT